MTFKADVWQKTIKEHQESRKETLDLQLNIQDAMINYLKTVGETEDFTLTYHEFGEIELHCNGDLFNLEQIGGFCDVFGLKILINNRTIIEDYLTDTTSVKTSYLFTTNPIPKKEEE